MQQSPETLRLRQVTMADMRPVKWLWPGRIPIGKLSLLVAKEGTGKGTLACWIAVAVMRGALWDSDRPFPQRVMLLGDEDGLEDTWLPRLVAAGATDEQLQRQLVVPDPLEDVRLNDPADMDKLRNTASQHGVGWILFDQLLDHLDGGRDGAGINNPKHIRDQLRPLRHVARDVDCAVTGILHPPKAVGKEFREAVGGSHQFNAVARVGLWLGPDPDSDAPGARILVRGKGNQGKEPPSIDFDIVGKQFERNGVRYDEPAVANLRVGERYVADIEGGAGHGFGEKTKTPKYLLLAPKVIEQLRHAPQSATKMSEAISENRDTVTKTLKHLEQEGLAHNNKGWIKGPDPTATALPSLN